MPDAKFLTGLKAGISFGKLMKTRKKKTDESSQMSAAIRPSETPPLDRIDQETLQRRGTQTADSGMKLHGEQIINARRNKTPMRGGVTDSEMMDDPDKE